MTAAVRGLFESTKWGFLPAGLALSMQFNWTEWAFGFCTEFIDLGTAGFLAGPFQVMAEWSIL